MSFIPHTDIDRKQMLEELGKSAVSDLFSDIPPHLAHNQLAALLPGLNEQELLNSMQHLAQQQTLLTSFVGAGSYEHYIPAAVWDLVQRGEFLTAYTPYQPEVSQGSLQVFFEYQSYMTKLTGMEVSNASLYDGATAIAESVLMALRISKKSDPVVLVPKTLHPRYRHTLQTLLQHHHVKLITVEYDSTTGTVLPSAWDEYNQSDLAAVVVPGHNFFGMLEEVDEITNWAHARGAIVIAQSNPVALAIYKEPGCWGDTGADIVCGEGQPLGIPLSYGGPYFGYMCCKKKFIRQMPGRIVGKTQDANGNEAYCLTLQTREQHIRRSKATSNICTNQGLMVLAATIYMSFMGYPGLENVARRSYLNAHELQQKLIDIAGVSLRFSSEFFHEFVIVVPDCDSLRQVMCNNFHIDMGYPLQNDYPELKNCYLVCATETKTEQQINQYIGGLRHILQQEVGHAYSE